MEEEEVLVDTPDLSIKYPAMTVCVWCNVERGSYEAQTFIPFCTYAHQKAYYDFLKEELLIDVSLSLLHIDTTIREDVRQHPIGKRSTEAFRNLKHYYEALVAQYRVNEERELVHVMTMNRVILPFTKRVWSAEEILIYKIYLASATALKRLRAKYLGFIKVLQKGGSAQ